MSIYGIIIFVFKKKRMLFDETIIKVGFKFNLII